MKIESNLKTDKEKKIREEKKREKLGHNFNEKIKERVKSD